MAVASALVASAAALLISLFVTWSRPSGEIIVFGALDRIDLSFETTGWERWHALDIAFVVLALAFVVVAAASLRRRPPARLLLAVVRLGALLALACVIVAGLDPGDESTSVRPVEIGPGAGVAVALGALLVAIVALTAAARRPRRTTL